MKRRRVDLVIITPLVSQMHHVPAGLVYVDQIMEEARLQDPGSSDSGDSAWLNETLRAIHRRFGRQVCVRLLDPMTLNGLFLIVRHRIRHFPSVITPAGHVIAQPDTEDIIQLIADRIR